MYHSCIIRKIKKHLKSGGVIAYPTESCYGFGADVRNYKAINKILRLKKRPNHKGLIIVADNSWQLKNIIHKKYYTTSNSMHNNDIQTNNNKTRGMYAEFAQYWPGFYSLILDANKNLLNNIKHSNKKVAVRLSAYDPTRLLCKELNTALISTSANLAKQRSIKDYRTCTKKFAKKVLIIKGNIGFAKKPSTIVDWDSKQILR